MYPQNLKYCKTHEWVKIEGNRAKVGITSFAISELTDLTYLEFRVEEGDDIEAGTVFGEVESVKTTSDLYAPVSGKVVAIHSELPDLLEEMMESPYEMGWMIEIEMSDEAQLGGLLDAGQYQRTTEEGN